MDELTSDFVWSKDEATFSKKKIRIKEDLIVEL